MKVTQSDSQVQVWRLPHAPRTVGLFLGARVARTDSGLAAAANEALGDSRPQAPMGRELCNGLVGCRHRLRDQRCVPASSLFRSLLRIRRACGDAEAGTESRDQQSCPIDEHRRRTGAESSRAPGATLHSRVTTRTARPAPATRQSAIHDETGPSEAQFDHQAVCCITGV